MYATSSHHLTVQHLLEAFRQLPGTSLVFPVAALDYFYSVYQTEYCIALAD
jgi:hypothetical protein